nr:hypothetical protein [Tanacetum cinerariifolium]
VVSGIAHQNRNGSVVAAWAEGNTNRNNDGSTEVQLHDNCYNDEILNMFTQEEQYIEILDPIHEPHEVPQNDINVIYEVSNVEQATEVEKVNLVNRKLRETNANLTTELARYKNQERYINLQTELEHTKERFENCIIKNENEYAKLWNDWYKKCEECKYDKISYYNDMQQKIERLQAQLGDQKGKCKDTPCVSNTLDPLPRKLENENVELEFQVRNYEKENAHLKTAYKNLFDFINVTWAQTKMIIDSL